MLIKQSGGERVEKGFWGVDRLCTIVFVSQKTKSPMHTFTKFWFKFNKTYIYDAFYFRTFKKIIIPDILCNQQCLFGLNLIVFVIFLLNFLNISSKNSKIKKIARGRKNPEKSLNEN